MLQKNKGGRPKKYGIRSQMILQVDINLIGRLDREAHKQGVSRNELITAILEKEVK